MLVLYFHISRTGVLSSDYHIIYTPSIMYICVCMFVYWQLGTAGFSGFVGGICGQPADLVNVRMQNDMKRPAVERRNYKHCFDGLSRIYRQGGMRELYSGASMMAGRSSLMTVGQAVGYDRCKSFLLWTGLFGDNPVCSLSFRSTDSSLNRIQIIDTAHSYWVQTSAFHV